MVGWAPERVCTTISMKDWLDSCRRRIEPYFLISSRAEDKVAPSPLTTWLHVSVVMGLKDAVSQVRAQMIHTRVSE